MEDSQNESFEDIELTEMEDRPEYQEPVLELVKRWAIEAHGTAEQASKFMFHK